ncbi:hypothetical protein MXMO3_01757 [Maritalea myrionectae]|uniref:Uncharacterized protein n=1 Tax=Maritalea myrionectae TaxID=454601 RepID=A0A2R4ME50_9HYPH|nr:hypothetical protein [Maritalea myrionectae]AVX04282.1 hypothetical protein MXMO3_01757 [Maritalea myrionectae]
MSIKPILFSGEMVRAIKDGRKTQTRRIAKITAVMGNMVAITSPDERLIELEPGEFRRGIMHYESTGSLSGPYKLPYEVGDLLWVRENWSGNHVFRNTAPSERNIFSWEGSLYFHDEVWYWADGSPKHGDWEKPRPSIHMPKWASRLTLRVTDVRIQRLQEISEDDALSEGVIESWEIVDIVGTPNGPSEINGYRYRVPELHDDDEGFEYAGDAFADLWDRLNAKRGFGWDANPWVAAYIFEVIHTNVNEVAA